MKHITILLLAATLGACTSAFDDWNTNPVEATPEQMQHDNLNTGAYFAQMQRGVFIVGKDLGGEYQITQALEGDLFASYLAPIQTWGYATYNNDHYVLYQDWYNAPFNDAYENIMTPWQQIYKVTDAISPARAMATVVKVLAMHRITDMYGPIPYSQFGTDTQVAYDAQKDVYYKFFDELDSAITVLSDYVATGGGAYMAKYDNVYAGNVEKWVRLANTLRLRLAMRLSGADEAKARKEAEAAIGHSIGLMQTADDEARLRQNANLTFLHPLWEIGYKFGDERMSATMDCYLKGYNDPRLGRYFKKATETGEYAGMRNGMTRVQKANYEDKTSMPNFEQTDDMNWMHAAEAWFLMAEAQLRWGIGSKSAEECYNEGIRVSFSAAGATGAEAYLNDDTALPNTKFTDVATKRETQVAGMLSMRTIKWNDAAPMKEKMERLMTQKWIALYPDGQEAWSEMRRTGYPGWVRIYSYAFQNEVGEGEMISRLKFPTTEYTNNGANTQAAVGLLGGPDAAGTKLWWAKKN